MTTAQLHKNNFSAIAVKLSDTHFVQISKYRSKITLDMERMSFQLFTDTEAFTTGDWQNVFH